jgi:peptidoglycan hydrolase CwlO-like protein
VHFLTKVFVFIATILSIGLSALVIAYATNVDRVAQDYTNELSRRQAAEAVAATASAQFTNEKQRLNEQLQSVQNQMSSMQGELSDLQGERTQLQVDRDRAVADRALTDAKIGELSELARTQAQLLDNYRTEVNTLRKNELTYRQRSLEMEDRLSDLQSQRDVLDQNYRALQEELAAIKSDARQVAAGVTSGTGGGDRPWTYAGPIITGRIESVQMDGGAKKTLAKLSVGTNDRVQKNMLMKVIRDNNFVANVVVTQTDLSFSVGVVDTLGQPVEVRAGDVVVSRLQ